MKALLLILTVIGAAITESSPAPAPQFRVSVKDTAPHVTGTFEHVLYLSS